MECELRVGTVSSVNKKKGMVSVLFEHWDGDVTEMLPCLGCMCADCGPCRGMEPCITCDCEDRGQPNCRPCLPKPGDRVVAGSLKGGGAVVLGVLRTGG